MSVRHLITLHGCGYLEWGRAHGTNCACHMHVFSSLTVATLLKVAAKPQFPLHYDEQIIFEWEFSAGAAAAQRNCLWVQMALETEANLTERMVLALSVHFS